MRRQTLLTCILLLAGCSDPIDEFHTDMVRGRAYEQPVYLLEVPNSWQREPPSDEADLSDTMQSLCEFYIQDPEGDVRITFHNFPSDSLSTRIPPIAQINRWKQQLNNPDPSSLLIEPAAWSGFNGLRFEGANREDATLGWSMQIAPEHYYHLSSPVPSEKDVKYQEMRADFTIKATGTPALIKKYRQVIIDFSESLELIDPIPNS